MSPLLQIIWLGETYVACRLRYHISLDTPSKQARTRMPDIAVQQLYAKRSIPREEEGEGEDDHTGIVSIVTERVVSRRAEGALNSTHDISPKA